MSSSSEENDVRKNDERCVRTQDLEALSYEYKVHAAKTKLMIRHLLRFMHSRMYTTKTKSNINMSTLHLKKGDPLPPFNGTLRLYNMRYCPWAQRTVLVLNAKNIPYEVVNINLADKPEWLTSKSPLAKVPAIETEDGVTLYESAVTSEYLDEVYPGRTLISKDPFRKAQDKLIVEHFSCVPVTLFKAVLNPESINGDVISNFFKALEFVQTTLINRGTKFLGGDEPGFVDYMIWPWFERIPNLPKYSSSEFTIESETFGKLLSYMEAMKEDPAVKQYLLSPEIHCKFLDGYRAKQPRYDFLE